MMPSLTPQILDAIKGSLLRVNNNGIHILATGHGHCQIVPILIGPAQVDQSSLDTWKVALECTNRVEDTFLFLVLASVVLGLA